MINNKNWLIYVGPLRRDGNEELMVPKICWVSKKEKNRKRLEK